YCVENNCGFVVRFNPSHSQDQPSQNLNLFTAFPVGDGPTSNRVNVLYEDSAGQVWAGTDEGLFRLDETNGQTTFRRIALNLKELEHQEAVRAFLEDREGS